MILGAPFKGTWCQIRGLEGREAHLSKYKPAQLSEERRDDQRGTSRSLGIDATGPTGRLGEGAARKPHARIWH